MKLLAPGRSASGSEMREETLPEKIVSRIDSLAPSLWREVDEFRARYRRLAPWPPNIFFPFTEWIGRFSLPDNDPDACRFVLAAYCAAAWRQGRHIVLFDPDARSGLRETRLENHIPSEPLWRIPAWCVYVKAAHIRVQGRMWDGFFAAPDALRKRHRLFLCFVSEKALAELAFYPVMLTLGQHPVKYSLAMHNDLMREACGGFSQKEYFDADFEEGLREALNLLTYIGAYGFEDREDSEEFRFWPYRLELKEGRLRYGEPKHIFLGCDFGDQIRACRAYPQLRDSCRHSHWELYYRLTESGEKETALRWHPATPRAFDLKKSAWR